MLIIHFSVSSVFPRAWNRPPKSGLHYTECAPALPGL
nr:MAG TPA: hypothetical protein [Caudoviricetes sp.]